MKLENVAKVEKGFIEKTISIQELPNGNVEIVAKAKVYWELLQETEGERISE